MTWSTGEYCPSRLDDRPQDRPGVHGRTRAGIDETWLLLWLGRRGLRIDAWMFDDEQPSPLVFPHGCETSDRDEVKGWIIVL